MSTITVSAPGKLMLLGEHAVVYGKPCIVTAIDQRMHATVTLTSEPLFHLDAPDVQVENYEKPMNILGEGDIPKGAKFVEQAVHNFLKKHPYSGGLTIRTFSDFHAQFGFGSSSASTVCVIGALAKLLNPSMEKKEIFDLSYQTVLDIQGKGSGFDIAAAVFGGTLFYVSPGTTIEPLDALELPLLIGYTGVKADTVTLINEVKKRAEKYPQDIERIYEEMASLAMRGREAVEKKDWKTLGELFDFNQGLLESLGVSSLKLALLIHSAREAGALGAKLSGAGKGDCMVALTEGNEKKSVIEALQTHGQYIEIACHAEGLRTE